MGSLDEFSVPVRLFLAAYRWRRVRGAPFQRPKKPVEASRLALVSSAGLVRPDQTPFDDTVRGGDVSFREIPRGTDPSSLSETHRSESWSREGLQRDKNLAFPLDRLEELVVRGRVGDLANRHVSFMGSITAPGRLVRDTGPEIARRLVSDEVDLALLVPV